MKTSLLTSYRSVCVRISSCAALLILIWQYEPLVLCAVGDESHDGQALFTPAGNPIAWGAASGGIRCRLVPVPKGTAIAGLDLNKPVMSFAGPEDMTFAVELQNVSSQPVRLLDTRFNASLGQSQGKISSSYFGPALFAFEFYGEDDHSFSQPEQNLINEALSTRYHAAVATEMAPGESIKMILSPIEWLPWLTTGLVPGKYRVTVRYKVDRENLPQKEPFIGVWAGEVASAPVAIALEGGPAKNGPDFAWGPAVDGLRAAVDFTSRMDTHASGEQLELSFHVQNVSTSPVQFCSEILRQGDRAIVIDDAGKTLNVRYIWHSGWPTYVHYVLKPGQEVVLKSCPMSLGGTHDEACQVLAAPPGQYTIRFQIMLNKNVMKDAGGNTLVPMEGDWTGVLETGSVPLIIRQEPH